MCKYYKAHNYTGKNTEYKTGHKAFFYSKWYAPSLFRCQIFSLISQ